MNAVPGTTKRAGEGITHVTHAELVAMRRRLPRRLAAPLDRQHGSRSGVHASVHRGRGMDYLESRAYQPGDDVRRLDWRLTARSGRLHTKVFQEERERTLWLVLDTHPSMRFGTRRRYKSVQAARAASLAAWMGVATSMRVGLACFGPARDSVAPAAGARGALAVVHALSGVCGETPQAAHGPEPLSVALMRLARMARGGSQVLILSDGDCVDAAARAHLVAMRRAARVRVLLVNDALETEKVPAGRYPMAWQETVSMVDLETRGARERFHHDLGHGARALRRMTRELNLPCTGITTGAEPLDAVARMLGVNLRGAAR